LRATIEPEPYPKPETLSLGEPTAVHTEHRPKLRVHPRPILPRIASEPFEVKTDFRGANQIKDRHPPSKQGSYHSVFHKGQLTWYRLAFKDINETSSNEYI
jgi:hypothetical protein